jgi:hypothetical protein
MLTIIGCVTSTPSMSHPSLDYRSISSRSRSHAKTLRTALTRLSFPINVNIEQNKETDNYEVEIRNFIGEKLVRRVAMRPGVEVEASKNQKDELQLSGNVSVLLELTRVRNANGCLVPRGCLSERRRYPADLQGPQQGYPKVLGWYLRVGEGQHCRGGISGSQEYGFLSRLHEQLRASLHHGLRLAPGGIKFETDVQYQHTIDAMEQMSLQCMVMPSEIPPSLQVNSCHYDPSTNSSGTITMNHSADTHYTDDAQLAWYNVSTPRVDHGCVPIIAAKSALNSNSSEVRPNRVVISRACN